MRLHFFNSAVIANSKMDYYWSFFFSQKSVMVHITGVSVITKFPQCESSVYFIKGASVSQNDSS